MINNDNRERKKLQTFTLIQFKLFELDRPFRMLYPRHELVNTKNLVSRWLISNIYKVKFIIYLRINDILKFCGNLREQNHTAVLLTIDKTNNCQ